MNIEDHIYVEHLSDSPSGNLLQFRVSYGNNNFEYQSTVWSDDPIKRWVRAIEAVAALKGRLKHLPIDTSFNEIPDTMPLKQWKEENDVEA